MNKIVGLPRLKFDFKNPDYAYIFAQRMANARRITEMCEKDPQRLVAMKAFYREYPWQFIADWGIAHEPRNIERKLPAKIPFVLMPKQIEFAEYIVRKWRSQEPGLVEKSRDVGATWVAITLSCTLCLFHEGMSIGFGSRKTEYVDKIGTLKPILPKGRIFMENVPRIFKGDWVAWRDSPYMRITFPETGSLIAGEAGDDIGRGDRTSIYFVDEAAHLERPELVEASLSQTTNCRIDMSSVRGMANPFAAKRWGGKIEVFIFDWRDDPRKDDAWYDKQVAELDPVVVAQEIDRDYSASVRGIVIPGAWVRAAIDAREKLGLALGGRRMLAFDVADEGQDKNALAEITSFEVTSTEEWSGKGSDIFSSTEYVFDSCDERGLREFRYDADGIGADVRGDARIINERRERTGQRTIRAIGYRGSDAVIDPEGIVEGTIGRDGDKGRKNEDFFQNRKAQAWWSLRKRFQRTHRWVVDKIPCAPDEIISINPKCPNHMKLVAELSQPTFKSNDLGKIVINKKPDGQKSPNLADALVIAFSPFKQVDFEVSSAVLAAAARMQPRSRVG
jgi:hypothetical protein